jgi:hypothetical protein
MANNKQNERQQLNNSHFVDIRCHFPLLPNKKTMLEEKTERANTSPFAGTCKINAPPFDLERNSEAETKQGNR